MVSKRIDRHKRTVIVWGLVILALHMLAIICERLNPEAIFGTLRSNYLMLIRSSIYIALFTAWGFSVRYRMIAVRTRNYLTGAAALMVLWMLLRTVKYAFSLDPNISRVLWYLYYVPMLCLPLLSVYVSLSLGKYGEFKLPSWIKVLDGATIILILLVLTNDWHQLIFIFPEDAVVFSDRDYSYGVCYYILSAFEAVYILLAYGIMLYRCRLPKRQRGMWIPIIPIAAMVLYTILYVTNYMGLRRFAPDLTVAACCLTVAVFECCIGNGLIQVNVHYKELFDHAGFPICITDQEYALYMTSACGGELAEYVQRHREQTEAMADDRVRIHSFPVTGGNVFWEENIAGIREEIDKLQDLQESLRESHMISLEEYRTNKEKTRLAEVNRLYDQMQLQTAGCLQSMQSLLQRLSEAEGQEEERILLGKIAVYGAYFKRRNNLLFVAETRKQILGEVLAGCLKESSAALAFLGIKASYRVEESQEYSMHDMMIIYDLIERVIEDQLDRLSAFIAVVRRSGNACLLTISLAVRGEASEFPEVFEVQQEDEGEYILDCRIEQGQEDVYGSFL